MLVCTHSQSAHMLWQMGPDGEEVCVEKSEGLIERLKNLRMLSPDARLYVELARCHCYHSIYLFVLNVLQPRYQCFSAILFFLFVFWVLFALMSFILAMLQSCSVAVSNQIPSDVFVYEETAQSLCV